MGTSAPRDPTKPLFHWYVDGIHGKELVIAFYTRPCRYARCTFCSLPTLSAGGESVTAQNLERQTDTVLASYSKDQLDQVAKVSVYTASSSLDQVSLPTRSLVYLVHKICDLPSLRLVSLESRPEYVEDWELKMLRSLLGEGVGVEIGIGYETHDPELRNRILRKGLSEGALRRLMGLLSENRGSLKAYLLLKPHWSLTEEAGAREARNGVEHLATLGRELSVPVSVHLNPTYMAKECSLTTEMIEHGYQPPELSSIIDVVRSAHELGVPIYVGLDDEGLAIEGGTFRSTGLDRARAVAAISAHNRHQSLERLEADVGPM
ncbi:MAG: hypothetical protein HYV07_16905 [Deltaproteobacteria bacterium]|nr:hypothetical protein [Deltaproteobacteria bacterium]